MAGQMKRPVLANARIRPPARNPITMNLFLRWLQNRYVPTCPRTVLSESRKARARLFVMGKNVCGATEDAWPVPGANMPTYFLSESEIPTRRFAPRLNHTAPDPARALQLICFFGSRTPCDLKTHTNAIRAPHDYPRPISQGAEMFSWCMTQNPAFLTPTPK